MQGDPPGRNPTRPPITHAHDWAHPPTAHAPTYPPTYTPTHQLTHTHTPSLTHPPTHTHPYTHFHTPALLLPGRGDQDQGAPAERGAARRPGAGGQDEPDDQHLVVRAPPRRPRVSAPPAPLPVPNPSLLSHSRAPLRTVPWDLGGSQAGGGGLRSVLPGQGPGSCSRLASKLPAHACLQVRGLPSADGLAAPAPAPHAGRAAQAPGGGRGRAGGRAAAAAAAAVGTQRVRQGRGGSVRHAALAVPEALSLARAHGLRAEVAVG